MSIKKGKLPGRKSFVEMYGSREAYVEALSKRCDLRKNCERCGKSYGRAVRNTHPEAGRSPYLESRTLWEKSKYCGKECRVAASADQRRGTAGRREAERTDFEKKQHPVWLRFCFPHGGGQI